MGTRKKNFTKKIQNKEEEEKNFTLFDRAEQGDTESMIKILIKSGRGYEIKEEDLSEILRIVRKASNLTYNRKSYPHAL